MLLIIFRKALLPSAILYHTVLPNRILPLSVPLNIVAFSPLGYSHFHLNVLLLLLLLLLIEIELSFGGSSPYTSTDRTNKNKYT
jgi:hypothetical protein